MILLLLGAVAWGAGRSSARVTAWTCASPSGRAEDYRRLASRGRSERNLLCLWWSGVSARGGRPSATDGRRNRSGRAFAPPPELLRRARSGSEGDVSADSPPRRIASSSPAMTWLLLLGRGTRRDGSARAPLHSSSRRYAKAPFRGPSCPKPATAMTAASRSLSWLLCMESGSAIRRV